jgi:hypothetical protein
MSYGRPMVTIPAQRDGELAGGTDASSLGCLVPAAPEPEIIRIDLGSSAWALILPPAQPGQAPASCQAEYLACLLARPVVSRLGLVRVPGLAGFRLGPAVLHHRRGRTAIYCDAGHLTSLAAGVLSVLADRVIYEAAEPGAAITVIPAGHSDLVAEDKHPAKAEIDGRAVTFSVCSDSISAGLTRALGWLWTVHTTYLPSAQPGPRPAGPASTRRFSGPALLDRGAPRGGGSAAAARSAGG